MRTADGRAEFCTWLTPGMMLMRWPTCVLA